MTPGEDCRLQDSGTEGGGRSKKSVNPLIVMFSRESPEIMLKGRRPSVKSMGTPSMNHSMVTVTLFSIIRQWRVAGRVSTVVPSGGPGKVIHV